MATHDLELMRQYPSARVLELDQGHLVYDSANTEQAASSVDRNSQPDANLSPTPAGELETSGEPEPVQPQET